MHASDNAGQDDLYQAARLVFMGDNSAAESCACVRAVEDEDLVTRAVVITHHRFWAAMAITMAKNGSVDGVLGYGIASGENHPTASASLSTTNHGNFNFTR